MYIITLTNADTQKAYDEKNKQTNTSKNHVHLCTIYLRAKPLFYFFFLLPSVCTKIEVQEIYCFI